MRRPARGLALWLLAGIAIVGAVGFAARTDRRGGDPLDPRSTEADGARALVLLGEQLGVPVALRAGRPEAGDTVALLLEDRLNAADRAALGDWVSGGGVLVVADTSSTFAPAPGPNSGAPAGPRAPGAPATADRVVGRGACPAGYGGVSAIAGVTERFAVEPADTFWCFGDPSGAALLQRQVGQGWVVAVAGPAPFTNRWLGRADNAVLAADLLVAGSGPTRAPGPVTVLGRSRLGEGDAGLWDLVPTGVRQGLGQLLVALVVFVWANARRLGRPVAEPRLRHLPASALCGALGRLYERGQQRDLAAGLLRARWQGRPVVDETVIGAVPRSVGNDVHLLGAETGASAAASGSGGGGGAAADAHEPVVDDNQLIELARRTEAARRAVVAR